MPEIKTIHDKDSIVLPNIDELRASQKKGRTGEGMSETGCRELNATQGHQADIREFTEAGRQAEIVRSAKSNQDAKIDRLDRTDRRDHPDITEL